MSQKWNYSMLKKLELFGSVFLWLIIFVKKLKRRGREKVKLMIKKSWKSDMLSWKSHGNSLLDFCGNPEYYVAIDNPSVKQKIYFC